MAYASSDKQGSSSSSHAQEYDLKEQFTEDTRYDSKGSVRNAPAQIEPLGKAIRNNYRLVAWCLAALTGLLLYGYDFVIVGNITSLRAFQRDYGHVFEGHLIIPSSWFALWKAASPLGTMAGAVIGGSFSDRFGRRASMAAGCIICAIGVGGCVGSAYTGSLAHRRGVFLGAKLVQGLGIGQTASAVQTYASEIITPRLRGPIMSMVPLLTLIGQVIGAAVIAAQSGVATKYAYVTPMLSMLAFTIPPFLAAIFMPESPVWSVDKSKTPAAERALIRLRGPNADTSDLLATIRASVMTEHRSRTTYMDCFKAAERRQTLLVMIAYTSPQFWGLTLLSNASYFLQVMGMGERASLLVVVVGILLGIVGNIGSVWTISSVGRRKLVLSGLSVTTALWLGVGIANCFANGTTLWFTTGACMAIILICGLSVWPAYYAIGAEVSSLHLRAKSQGLGWGVNGATTTLFAIILPYLYNIDAGNLQGKVGFVYFGLSALCLLASWFLVKETKDLSQEDIDKLYKREAANDGSGSA